VVAVTTRHGCGSRRAGHSEQTRGESCGVGAAGHAGHSYRVVSRPSRSLPLFRGTFAGHLSGLSRHVPVGENVWEGRPSGATLWKTTALYGRRRCF
jgi:hypothetical protein